jgi:hypothetical protein
MSSSVSEPPRLDLPAYLERIGYSGSLEPTQPMLEARHPPPFSDNECLRKTSGAAASR